MARIPTEPNVGPISSAGSSHSRLTSAEDNEEALLFALSGDRSCGRRKFRAVGEKKKELYILGLKRRGFTAKRGKRESRVLPLLFELSLFLV
jgi:hypothetical protein